MDWKKAKERWQKTEALDRFLILIILLGALVVLVSLFRGIVMDRQVQVEYISKGEGASEVVFYVDIEGAVINPGVYGLPERSRLIDVLVKAGGLAEKADREFCEKNLNMAEQIKDGQKIYIPSKGTTGEDMGYFEAALSSKKVSINSGTLDELDTLWGIGKAKAELIVKNRPFQSLDELVNKNILSRSVVERNKDVLTLY